MFKMYKVYLPPDMANRLEIESKKDYIPNISSVIRRSLKMYFQIKRTGEVPVSKKILAYLNSKAELPRAFFGTNNNLLAIETLLEHYDYKESQICKAIDKAIALKYTKEQLKPESLFWVGNFEELLEKPSPENNTKKKPELHKGLDPDIIRDRERAK